jgi:FixJ family two-component response regulator
MYRGEPVIVTDMLTDPLWEDYRYDSLTSREREVFALVTDGSLNKQIAHQLGTSERTIKAHRAQVVQKMKADSVADLVRMADRLKIAPQRGTKSAP